MGLWKRPPHTTSPISPPTNNTSTTHPEDNYGTSRSATKPALGTRVTKRKDSDKRFTHGECKEQEYYGRENIPGYFQDNSMSKGRVNEASGQASGPSTPRTALLEEGFITCREPGEEGCGSRDDIRYIGPGREGCGSRDNIEHSGPRESKFTEKFDESSKGAPAEYFEHLKGTPAKEGLSEGSRGGTGRETAGEGRVGHDRVGNDHVGDDHAGFQDVQLDDNRHPDVSPPTSPGYPAGRSLSAVSSVHEGGPSHWERPPARRQATEPTVLEPTSPRSTGHIETMPELNHLTSVHSHPSPASSPSSPGTPRTPRTHVNPKSSRAKDCKYHCKTFVSWIINCFLTLCSYTMHKPRTLWSYTMHKFRTHPIITSIAILLLLLGFALFSYLLAQFIPWVVHLLKLKSYIDSKLDKINEWKGKIDQFKDQVASKFRDWLGDGKSLADNVKEKIKEKVTGAIDNVPDWFPKTRVKVRDVDKRGVVGPVGIAGRAVGRRGLFGNVGSLFGAVSGGKAETVAVTSEVVMATATSWESSSIWRLNTVVEATETNGAVARRGKIPLPFVLLGGLAGLARGEERFPKVSDRIGTTVLESQATPTPVTTPTSTEYTPTSTSTRYITNAGLQARKGGGKGGGSSGKGGNTNKDKTPEPGHSDNHTSSALGHRDFLPYPILILRNMLRYARAEIVNPMEKFPPASTAARSSTTGVASALRPRQRTSSDCFINVKSVDEAEKCCSTFEKPVNINACQQSLQWYKAELLDEFPDQDESTDEDEWQSLPPPIIVGHVIRNEGTGASGGAKGVLGESLVSSTVSTTSTAVASTDEELIEPSSTETANLAVRRFGGLSWW